MNILAIETSGRDASLALLEGNVGEAARLVGETVVRAPERSARMLAPRLQELLTQHDWLMSQIELIAVAIGPGSFTGLRVGVTMAKALAYANGAAVVAVNVLDAIASQAPTSVRPLWTVMDAQRQELFAAKYIGEHIGALTAEVVADSRWLQRLEPGDAVSGPVLPRLRDRLPSGVAVVDETCWYPQAAAVGRLGWVAYDRGQRDDMWKLTPLYLRLSAAEEKAGGAAAD